MIGGPCFVYRWLGSCRWHASALSLYIARVVPTSLQAEKGPIHLVSGRLRCKCVGLFDSDMCDKCERKGKEPKHTDGRYRNPHLAGRLGYSYHAKVGVRHGHFHCLVVVLTIEGAGLQSHETLMAWIDGPFLRDAIRPSVNWRLLAEEVFYAVT